MPNELKPCPFCGGKAFLDRERISDSSYCYLVIRCLDCNARFMGKPTMMFFEENEDKHLIEKWNRRVNGALNKKDYRSYCKLFYTASPSECFLGIYKAGCKINKHDKPSAKCRKCKYGVKTLD